ncbi:hypothetical protein [Deinococcus aquaticus]|uniref:hypothetical protein n=1 Tax=Deinococcus aquaticus TaxID=328692 RepID=UPI00360A6212
MTAPPELLTFGALRAAQVPFRREKPLLLLAYLSLRGPQERRAVARLFWPDATDPMNSLSVALGQLRRASSTLALVHTTDTQLTTTLTCDVPALLRACADTDLSGAQTLYRGLSRRACRTRTCRMNWPGGSPRPANTARPRTATCCSVRPVRRQKPMPCGPGSGPPRPTPWPGLRRPPRRCSGNCTSCCAPPDTRTSRCWNATRPA